MSSEIIPVGQEWIDIKNMSGVLVKSGFLPKSVDTAEKACAIMLMGRELGIGPMESFSKISVILGKPTVGAELQKAMVHKKLPGAILRVKSSDDRQCTIEAARPGDPISEYQYTIEEATAMGLHSKDNWKKQAKVMLRWRCISQVCRTVFPDCLSGISYTPEELGAHVNEEGEVIDIPVSDQQKKTIDEEDVNPINYNGPSPDQIRRLCAIAGSKGILITHVDALLAEKYDLKSKKDISPEQYQYICDLMESGKFDEVFTQHFPKYG